MVALDQRWSEQAVHLVFLGGEVYRLPQGVQELRVLSGTAWVSFAGKDIILNKGELIYFPPCGDFAVASALGKSMTIVEIQS